MSVRRLRRRRREQDVIGLPHACACPVGVGRVANIDDQIMVGFHGLYEVPAPLGRRAVEKNGCAPRLAKRGDQRRGQPFDRGSAMQWDQSDGLGDGEDAATERQRSGEQFDELRRKRQHRSGMLADQAFVALPAQPRDRRIAYGDARRRLRSVEQRGILAGQFADLDKNRRLIMRHRFDDDAQAPGEHNVNAGWWVILAVERLPSRQAEPRELRLKRCSGVRVEAVECRRARQGNSVG